MPEVVALIPAAGRGDRFGGDLPKQFGLFAGRPLLLWALEPLLANGITRITLAVPEKLLDRARQLLPTEPEIRVVAGGRRRQDSVAACLEASPGDRGDLILVHDGARPATAAEDVRATIAAAEGADGAVLGRPQSDTLKRVRQGWIEETVDRVGLFRAETPQVFRRPILERALEQACRAGVEATDEAVLVERLAGARLRAVAARWPNPKLTHPGDRRLVEALLVWSSREAGRSGKASDG